MASAGGTPSKGGGAGRVVVWGATSYVGAQVVEALLAHDYEVVAVSRSGIKAQILLSAFADRISIMTPDDLYDLPKGITAVLNLAYMKDEKSHVAVAAARKAAKRLHDSALHLGATRLVHASTISVFGYTLSAPPLPRPVRRRFDHPYIGEKIEIEHQLQRLSVDSDYSLAIVRLGHVVGPGSPVWTVAVAQRLLEGHPVGVADQDGYANAAYASNVANYFVDLVARPKAQLDAFGAYHHVADLAGLRWSELIDPLAEQIGVTPIRVDALPSFGASNPLGTAAAIIKQATRARLGAYARAATAVVPVEPIAARMSLRRQRSVGISSGEEPFYNEGDRGFLAVMSEPHQFTGYTVDGWRPPISPALAIRDINRWARDAGLSVL